MDYIQEPMYEITPSGDYLHVVCVQCKEPCELDFLGRDPSMVLIEIKCPKCGSSGDWKLHKAGFGFPSKASPIHPQG
jgi:ribosomal protein S27E